jgi:UDP-sugar pyrophosphorylase
VPQIVQPSELHVAADSVLVLDGANISIRSLRVEGALVIRAAPGARVRVDNLTVNNKGWEWKVSAETRGVFI